MIASSRWAERTQARSRTRSISGALGLCSLETTTFGFGASRRRTPVIRTVLFTYPLRGGHLHKEKGRYGRRYRVAALFRASTALENELRRSVSPLRASPDHYRTTSKVPANRAVTPVVTHTAAISPPAPAPLQGDRAAGGASAAPAGGALRVGPEGWGAARCLGQRLVHTP